MRLFYYFLLLFLVSTSFSHSKDKAYFAGGCFWCMEESFEMLEGVEEVISGYSGGITANPTYREVTYGDTGPFDAYGQFCDKGYSYRSAAFYTNHYEKDLIEKDFKRLEKKFNKKVVTYIREFEKFYIAEDRHQDYYQVYFLNYLKYKKACKRERILDIIWGS